jgi:hypothetical protein
MPLQLWDKSDFIPELTINAERLRAKSVQHPFLLLAICWSLRPDPNPRSSIFKLKSPMADQNQSSSPFGTAFFDPQLRFLPLSSPDRLNPLISWSPSKINHHPISSVLWETLTPLSLLKPNPTEYLSNQLWWDPMRVKMPLRTSRCPLSQAGGTGIRVYLRIKV